jgi:hypothetical protein
MRLTGVKHAQGGGPEIFGENIWLGKIFGEIGEDGGRAKSNKPSRRRELAPYPGRDPLSAAAIIMIIGVSVGR